MKKIISALIFLVLSANAQAAQAPVTFKNLSKESSIKFEATQAGSPINGEFKSFTADITFSPEALDKSHAKVAIDMGSFAIGDKDAQESLPDKEWFNIAAFPQAVFESTSFKSLGDKKYETTGNLTIKDISNPITLIFTLNEFSPTVASISGDTTLRRLGYNVGEKSTESIKDEVKVTFDLKVSN